MEMLLDKGAEVNKKNANNQTALFLAASSETTKNANVEDENTGERIPLREQAGMYMLKLWIKNQSFQEQAGEAW